MGLVEVFPTKMIQKGPVAQVFKGNVARSEATVTKKVGKTTKTNGEIDAFNKTYIRDNPEYSFTSSNCQHYVYKLVEMLCGDTSLLIVDQKLLSIQSSGLNPIIRILSMCVNHVLLSDTSLKLEKLGQ